MPTKRIPFQTVPECDGCAKDVNGLCRTYENPGIFWRNLGTQYYGCGCATHWTPVLDKDGRKTGKGRRKVRVGQGKTKQGGNR